MNSNHYLNILLTKSDKDSIKPQLSKIPSDLSYEELIAILIQILINQASQHLTKTELLRLIKTEWQNATLRHEISKETIQQTIIDHLVDLKRPLQKRYRHFKK